MYILTISLTSLGTRHGLGSDGMNLVKMFCSDMKGLYSRRSEWIYLDKQVLLL
jgi:hypothetical protein